MEKNFSLDKPILDSKGQLLQVGRSFSGLPAFSRSDLSFFTRQTAYCGCNRYFVISKDINLCIEVYDGAAFGYARVAVFTRHKGELAERSASSFVPLSLCSFDMPDTPNYGDTLLRLKDFSVDMIRSPGKRYLRCHIDGFDDVRSLYVNLSLTEAQGNELYCANVLPQGGSRLAHRRFGMRVQGQVVCGAENYRLDPETCFAMLDWERSTAKKLPNACVMQVCTELAGEQFSFCFSSGICPEGFGGENIICVDYESFDPGEASLTVDSRDYMRQWKMRTADKRCELTFTPEKIFIQELFKKPFAAERIMAAGNYSGSFRLSSGRTVAFDNIFGFGEYIPTPTNNTQ